MRRVLYLVGAIVFVDTMFFAALTPLLPQYAAEFGIGKTGWGLLQAAYPAGALVGAIPSGMVAARAGVKPTVIVGLCCIALTSTAFGFADSVWQLASRASRRGSRVRSRGQARSPGSSPRRRRAGAAR